MRWFVTSRPTLQEMLKGVIQGEMKGHGIITEEIKNTSKGGNTGKYRGQYKCIFVFNSFCSICESRSFVSDSLHSHGLQPATMLCPGDSPGKNTGVGCHFLPQRMKVKSESEVAQSCPTLSDPMDCSLPGSPSMGFSRQEYWSGVPLPSPRALKLCLKSFRPT